MLDYYYLHWDGWNVTPTFTYVPSFAPSSQRQPRVRSVKFGDGYEQRSLDGLHADLRVWSLPFEHLTVGEADAIEAFFVTYQTAVVPFLWAPPRSTTAAKFLCRSWRRTVDSPTTDTIVATFEEVADL